MAKFRINKPHLQTSVIADALSKKVSVKDVADKELFVLSFKHLDKKQGMSLEKWEEDKKLAIALDVLSNYCQRPLMEQCDGKKFTIYGGFPAKSDFKHPSFVPEDANWGRIHIDGTHVIAGHVFKNIFYVVFLDHEHRFYITEKKNT